MADRVKQVIPTLENMGMSIGVFNYDVTSRPLYKFSVLLKPVNSVPVFVNRTTENVSLAARPRGLSVNSPEGEEEAPPEDPEEDKDDPTVETKDLEDYPFIGPNCGYKSHELPAIEKANCLRKWRLRNNYNFDSLHLHHASTYNFQSSFINVVARGGTNLYYSVQAANAALSGLTYINDCFCDKIRQTKCYKSIGVAYDRENEPDNDDEDEETTSSIGNWNFPDSTYQGRRPVYPIVAVRYNGDIGLAFVVGQAGHNSLRRVSINGEIVYDNSGTCSDELVLHDKFISNGTEVKLWEGGESQPIPTVMYKAHGVKSPAYRDLTILTFDKFPNDFLTEAKLEVLVEVVSYKQPLAGHTETQISSPEVMLDVSGQGLYTYSAGGSGLDVYNYVTKQYDRTIASDVTNITGFDVSHNGNIILRSSMGGGNKLIGYKDYLFVDRSEVDLGADVANAVTGMTVRNGLQIACGIGNKFRMYWEGQLERELILRGDIHTIITRGNSHYVFTTKRAYKISSMLRIISGTWVTPSTHVIRDDGNKSFVLFDSNLQDVRSIRFLANEGFRINWQRTITYQPKGNLPRSTDIQTGNIKYISGDNVITLSMTSGRLVEVDTITNSMDNLTNQFYDKYSDTVVYVSGGKVHTRHVAPITFQTSITLEDIIRLVVGDDVIIDVDEPIGLYGFTHTGGTNALTELMTFFNLRVYDRGDNLLITNKKQAVVNYALPDYITKQHKSDPTTNLTHVSMTFFDILNDGNKKTITVSLEDRATSYTEYNKRAYSLSLHADSRTMERMAETILFSKQDIQSETSIHLGMKGILGSPGDFVDGIGYIHSTSRNGYENNIVTHQYTQDDISHDKLYEDITLLDDTSLNMGTCPNRTNVGAVSPFILQAPAISAQHHDDYNNLIYLAAVPLLINQSRAGQADRFISDQVSTNEYPTSTIKFGSLVSMSAGMSGSDCEAIPFTTEYNNSIEVQFETEIPENYFTSATYDDLLADEGLNMLYVGEELIQFMDVTYLSADRKHVRFHGGMFRGRRGTNPHTNSHVAGERVYFMGPDTMVPASVNTSNMLSNNGIFVGITSGISDTQTTARLIGAEYKFVGQKPWDVASYYLSTDESDDGDYIFWLNRHKYELPFIDDTTNLVKPSLEHLRTDGYTNMSRGFAKAVTPTLYMIRGDFDQNRFETAKIAERYSIGLDEEGPLVDPSNYILRRVDMAADDGVVLFTENMLFQDGIDVVGGDNTNIMFIVESIYEEEPSITLSSFHYPIYKGHEDTVMDGKCK